MTTPTKQSLLTKPCPGNLLSARVKYTTKNHTDRGGQRFCRQRRLLLIVLAFKGERVQNVKLPAIFILKLLLNRIFYYIQNLS